MGPFKAKDPRKPRAPRESGDSVPLLPVRRKSRKQNTWNDDNEQDTELGSLRRRSSETLHRFSEGENEEDVGRLSVEKGGYRNSEDNGVAKTSIDDPQSVGPGQNLLIIYSLCYDRSLQNHYRSTNLLHQILTQMN